MGLVGCEKRVITVKKELTYEASYGLFLYYGWLVTMVGHTRGKNSPRSLTSTSENWFIKYLPSSYNEINEITSPQFTNYLTIDLIF